jgi:6-bladed beta-propeller
MGWQEGGPAPILDGDFREDEMPTLRIVRLHGLLVVTATLALFAPSAGAQRRGKEIQKPRTPPMQLPTRAWKDLVARDRVIAQVGSEDEEGPALFSHIGSVEIGRDSTIYVTEHSSRQIRAFRSDGRFIASAGRYGRGPGEFVEMGGVSYDGDSTMLVNQGYLGVSEFVARAGSFTFRRIHNQARGIRSACSLDGQVFVSVGVEQGIVEVLNADRRPLRSFGTTFSRESTKAARAMSVDFGAMMTCDVVHDRMYLTAFGRIRSYGADGTLAWETTLPDFQHAWFVEQPAVVFPDDHLEGIHALSDRHLLVQVQRVDYTKARRTPSTGPSARVSPPVVARRTFLIDATSGKLLAQVSGAPTLRAIRYGLAVEAIDDPYPMFRVHALTPATSPE